MSLWRKRNDVSHDGQNRPKLFTMTATTDNEFSIKSDDLSIKQSKGIGMSKEALAQPEQEPVAWKLVPVEPTEEMLKAMDECSKEGYDERLYAGHAASVYMAAIDAAPTPPQRKPLTAMEVYDVVHDADLDWHTGFALGEDENRFVVFARAIEAAHGIKE